MSNNDIILRTYADSHNFYMDRKHFYLKPNPWWHQAQSNMVSPYLTLFNSDMGNIIADVRRNFKKVERLLGIHIEIKPRDLSIKNFWKIHVK